MLRLPLIFISDVGYFSIRQATYISSWVDRLLSAETQCFITWMSECWGGDGDLGRKDAKFTAVRAVPTSDRNDRPEGPFSLSLQASWECPGKSLASQGSHLWVQHLLLRGVKQPSWDGTESLSMAWRTFRSFCCCLNVIFVLANK